MSLERGWYVYGVAPCGVSASDLPPGIEGQPVELVTQGVLSAVVSCVPLDGFREAERETDLAEDGWLARAVRAHEAVLEAVAAHAGVLPMRFGSCYSGRDDVGRLLAGGVDGFVGELQRLHGTSEWGVKLVADRKTLVAEAAEEVDAETGPAEGEGAGTAWMLRRRRAAEAEQSVGARLAGVAESVHGRLSAVALESVASPVPRTPPDRSARLLNASYLVADVAAFSRAVAGLRDELASLGVDLSQTGPWPPYHFVHLADANG